ncbi:MAG: peptidylprolyl isomerase, partial [Campylobacteraceae bacterium]|nr:peptidylprolyl isomerase [Campylobacteraceae bacterium]
MITWMQHHKKYLIITIWISVIAFVGAGFVGWGAYDFNLGRTSSVAKVGNHQISIQSFQTTYSSYFNYYNSAVYNGELTDELAKQIGLNGAVLNALIDEAILVNFADDMGIIALDSDVLDLITSDEKFQINGSFSKDVYYRVLQNSGFKPSDYEEMLKKQAVLNKVYSVVMDLPVSELEKEVLGSAMFMQDRLSVATITVENSEISISDNETESFWETNKNNFLSEKVYYFESIFIPSSTDKLSDEDIRAYWEEIKYFYKDSDEKVLDYDVVKAQVEAALRLKNAEKDALKTYLAFKKGESAAQKNITVKESTIEYDVSAFQTLSTGDVLTPVKKDNGYEVLKLTRVALPAPKTYEEAKAQVYASLQENKRSQLLVERAQARLALFSGKDVGFVGMSDQNVAGLAKEQSSQL